MYRKGFLLCLLASLLFCAGCPKKVVKDETATTPPPAQTVAPALSDATPGSAVKPGITEETIPDKPQVVAPIIAPAAVEKLPLSGLRNVPFEYDQHLLTDAAREILAANAAILKANPQTRMLLAGYCDERGSDQYNIALGERRAEAVRNYLTSLGVAESLLETVSYGEEKPLDPGHDESAWVKNRRVEFLPR